MHLTVLLSRNFLKLINVDVPSNNKTMAVFSNFIQRARVAPQTIITVDIDTPRPSKLEEFHARRDGIKLISTDLCDKLLDVINDEFHLAPDVPLELMISTKENDFRGERFARQVKVLKRQDESIVEAMIILENLYHPVR